MKNGAAHSYQDLELWKRSIELTVVVYSITKKLPTSEVYGIASQAQRAAVSVPSNIAEGQKRFGAKDKLQFCGVALGSLAELETQLIIIEKVYKIDTKEAQEESAHISRMLHALVKSLRSKS